MVAKPSHAPAVDPRVQVADLIAEARELLATPDPVIKAAGLSARAADLGSLLRLLADAAAGAIAGPVLAIDVLPGDVLLLDGAMVTVTSAPRPGVYRIEEQQQHGVALDWRSGSQRGVIFRRGNDMLVRLPRREGPRVITVRPDSATGGGSTPTAGCDR